MLSRADAVLEIDAGRAIPDRLLRETHAQYRDYAARMQATYREGIGLTRAELHRRAERVLEREATCPTGRIRALCQLLDERAAFVSPPDGGASRLRRDVFGFAAAQRAESPLVTTEALRARIAHERGRNWCEIERALFADLSARHVLASYPHAETPESLLARYNLAQLQVCLRSARGLTIRAGADFKMILRQARLFGLMHEVRRTNSGGYGIALTGPASLLRRTSRYGVLFARLIPSLIACRDWTATAEIATPWGGTASLEFAATDGYRTHVRPPLPYDSEVEMRFAASFANQRGEWSFVREGEVITAKQRVFIPDFVLMHPDGTRVLFEIVGFWTDEYLEKKRALVARIADRRVLLAVPRTTKQKFCELTKDLIEDEKLIWYTKSVPAREVLARLEAMRAGNREGTDVTPRSRPARRSLR